MNIQEMDANILLSIINLKLRDYYSDLDNLCEDMDIKKEDLIEKLKKEDYKYVKEVNQFK